MILYSSSLCCSKSSFIMVFPCVRFSASNQSFKQTVISKCFGINLLLQGFKTLSLAENVLSDTTVKAGGVSISRAMVERTENYFLCSFHHDKTSNVSHDSSSFLFISADIVFKYKLSSSNEPALEECFFLVLKDNDFKNQIIFYLDQ